MTGPRYDPHAELLAAIYAPAPEPIVVDREMVGLYLGLTKNAVRHLFEQHHDDFEVIGTRHPADRRGGRPRYLYDLRQIVQVVNAHKNGAHHR